MSKLGYAAFYNHLGAPLGNARRWGAQVSRDHQGPLRPYDIVLTLWDDRKTSVGERRWQFEAWRSAYGDRPLARDRKSQLYVLYNADPIDQPIRGYEVIATHTPVANSGARIKEFRSDVVFPIVKVVTVDDGIDVIVDMGAPVLV